MLYVALEKNRVFATIANRIGIYGHLANLWLLHSFHRRPLLWTHVLQRYCNAPNWFYGFWSCRESIRCIGNCRAAKSLGTSWRAASAADCRSHLPGPPGHAHRLSVVCSINGLGNLRNNCWMAILLWLFSNNWNSLWISARSCWPVRFRETTDSATVPQIPTYLHVCIRCWWWRPWWWWW